MPLAAVKEMTSGGQLLRARPQHPISLLEGMFLAGRAVFWPTVKSFGFGHRLCLNENDSVLASVICSL